MEFFRFIIIFGFFSAFLEITVSYSFIDFSHPKLFRYLPKWTVFYFRFTQKYIINEEFVYQLLTLYIIVNCFFRLKYIFLVSYSIRTLFIEVIFCTSSFPPTAFGVSRKDINLKLGKEKLEAMREPEDSTTNNIFYENFRSKNTII